MLQQKIDREEERGRGESMEADHKRVFDFPLLGVSTHVGLEEVEGTKWLGGRVHRYLMVREEL